MARAFVLVLDSVGIGAAPDAASYGDEGADTIGHIAEACACGSADRAGLRTGPLRLPNLVRLGLGEACRMATGRLPPGLEAGAAPRAATDSASRCRRERTRPPATGSLPASRFHSTGATSRAHFRASRTSSSPICAGSPIYEAFWATVMLPVPKSLPSSAKSTSEPASRSATRQPTASFRSQPTRTALGSSGSIMSVRSRAGSSIRSGSAASSLGHSSATLPRPSPGPEIDATIPFHRPPRPRHRHATLTRVSPARGHRQVLPRVQRTAASVRRREHVRWHGRAGQWLVAGRHSYTQQARHLPALLSAPRPRWRQAPLRGGTPQGGHGQVAGIALTASAARSRTRGPRTAR